MTASADSMALPGGAGRQEGAGGRNAVATMCGRRMLVARGGRDGFSVARRSWSRVQLLRIAVAAYCSCY
eukprot:COSAG01_NODE_5345_length_4320_cov_64.852168_4_plen_69_part_00